MSVLAAAAALAVSVTGFGLEQVNSERTTVRPGADHPFCQAIPITVVRPRLRHRGGPARVRVSFAAPGHRPRTQTVRLPARAGTRTLHYTPATLGLRDGAFTEGRYTLTVRRDGRRLARASFTLTGGRTC
jgi:hypothetical protein